MAKKAEVNAAMLKVLQAIKRGTLPQYLSVRNNGGIGLEMWPGRRPGFATLRETQLMDLEEEQRILAWLQRNWPDGVVMQRVERTTKIDGARRRKPTWYDVRTWHSENDGVHSPTIIFSFRVEHECREWRSDPVGARSQIWEPIWRCTACSKPMGKTAARNMGLIP